MLIHQQLNILNHFQTYLLDELQF